MHFVLERKYDTHPEGKQLVLIKYFSCLFIKHYHKMLLMSLKVLHVLHVYNPFTVHANLSHRFEASYHNAATCVNGCSKYSANASA